MCLYINQARTKEIEEKLKNSPRQQCIFWKVYSRVNWKNQFSSGTFLRPLYYPKTGKVSFGRIFSCRPYKKITENEKDTNRIDYGIHVYITKKKAIAHYTSSLNPVLVPVICELKDFIAAGNDNDAVFTKVRLTKRSYQKAIK